MQKYFNNSGFGFFNQVGIFGRAILVVALILLQFLTMSREACAGSVDQQEQLRLLIGSSVAWPEQDKLAVVNAFFNRLKAESDQSVWYRNDYWALPEELLTKGAGDCEDFALAKYQTLVEMGVSEDRLRLVHGKLFNHSATGIETHMVLIYASAAGESLVLDNAVSDISPLSSRRDFTPIFAFNRFNVWRYSGAEWINTGGRSRLKKWNDYLVRIALKNRGALAMSQFESSIVYPD